MTHRGPFQPLLFCDSVVAYTGLWPRHRPAPALAEPSASPGSRPGWALGIARLPPWLSPRHCPALTAALAVAPRRRHAGVGRRREDAGRRDGSEQIDIPASSGGRAAAEGRHVVL